MIDAPFSTHNMHKLNIIINLSYDVTSTSALRTVSCLFLILLDLFDSELNAEGIFNVV